MKNKKVYIDSTLLLMSASDVANMVPDDVMLEIKKYDQHPVFAAMTVGYEGESTGQLYNKSNGGAKWYKQLWPLKAVKQLATQLKHEVPLYAEVHDLNKVGIRQQIGRVVAATTKVIDDVTHAMAIAYMTDKVAINKLQAGEYNACSMEAHCMFSEAKSALRWIVEQVKEVSGLVIFNGQKMKPGFKDAHIHAVLAAMAHDDDDEDDDADDDSQHKSNKGKHGRKEQKMDIILEDVKKFIDEKQVKPSVLFSTQTLLAEPKVVDALENERKVAVVDKDKKIGDLEKELAPFKKQQAQAKAGEFIKKSALLKDVSKECVAYLQKVLKVEVTDEATAQATVDAAIKEQLEVMKETGITFGKQQKNNADDKGKEGAENDDPAGNNKSGAEDNTDGAADYTDPKVNPLIPQ